jgi:hypothetical protein
MLGDHVHSGLEVGVASLLEVAQVSIIFMIVGGFCTSRFVSLENDDLGEEGIL